MHNILLFFLGACLGSFYLCILDNYPYFRYHHKSCCPFCHKALKAYQLIPIISYVILKGKCQYCHHPLSLRYLLYELLGGLLMVGCFQHFNMFVALNIIILVAISLADIRHGIIYDSLLIILLVIIIVYQPIHLKLSLIILAIGSLLAICNLMGFGDVKLIAIYALFLSYKQLLLLLFIASFLALLIAKKREIKFAPYLSIAIISILVV